MNLDAMEAEVADVFGAVMVEHQQQMGDRLVTVFTRVCQSCRVESTAVHVPTPFAPEVPFGQRAFCPRCESVQAVIITDAHRGFIDV